MGDSQFQSLTQQFNTTLSNYQQMYKDYMTSLNPFVGCYADTSNRAMANTSNNAYLSMDQCQQLAGTNTYYGLQNTQGDSSANATSWCSASSNLSQVTQYGTSTACTTIDGVTMGGPWANAVYSTKLPDSSFNYIGELQKLNQQLQNLNHQILQQVNQTQSQYQKQSAADQQQQSTVVINKQILEDEREKLGIMMKENVMLSRENDNNQLVVTQTYSMYLLLLFIVIILIALLIKFSIPSGNEQRGGGGKKGFFTETSFLLGIIILFMIVSRFLKPLYI